MFTSLVILGYFFTISYFSLKNLSHQYDALKKDYLNLFDSSNSTNIAFGWIDEPLGKKIIPTIDELKTGLRNDTTNEFIYDPSDYDCFHYTATLKLHGRANHYDIGIIAIYGVDLASYKTWTHTINAIISLEGLVYIEPQLDELWFLDNYSEISINNTYIFPGFGSIYVEGIKIIFDY
jgi:hypothetical protein